MEISGGLIPAAAARGQHSRMTQCPHCLSNETERIRRTFWMCFFPTMIRVYCYGCTRRSVAFVDNRHPRKAIDL